MSAEERAQSGHPGEMHENAVCDHAHMPYMELQTAGAHPQAPKPPEAIIYEVAWQLIAQNWAALRPEQRTPAKIASIVAATKDCMGCNPAVYNTALFLLQYIPDSQSLQQQVIEQHPEALVDTAVTRGKVMRTGNGIFTPRQQAEPATGRTYVEVHQAPDGPESKELFRMMMERFGSLRHDVNNKLSVITGNGEYGVEVIESLPTGLLERSTLNAAVLFKKATTQLHQISTAMQDVVEDMKDSLVVKAPSIGLITVPKIQTANEKAEFLHKISRRVGTVMEQMVSEIGVYLVEIKRGVKHIIDNPPKDVDLNLLGDLDDIIVMIGEMNGALEIITSMIQGFMNIHRTDIPQFARHSIDDIAEGLVSMWNRQSQHNIKFETSAESDANKISCDNHLMARMLENLMKNATEALDGIGEPGEIGVRLIYGVYDYETGTFPLTIEIQDNGPGVPEEMRERIFEPMVSTKNRGSGFGLASAKRMVEQHGGTIGVTAAEGGGAVFRIQIPPQTLEQMQTRFVN